LFITRSSVLVFAFCVLPCAFSFAQPPAATGNAAPVSPSSQASTATPQSAIVLGDSLNALQPTVENLHQTLASLNVNKWKAPGDVRGQAQSDVDSMQRDLNATLPDLLTQAKAAGTSLAPSFAVYRNVDALYDVLLRVTETATLAGAQDARGLEQSRAMLEQGRSQLGAALLQSSQAQDAEVTQLRTAAAAAAAAAAAPQAAPAKTVVDDGPAPAKAKPAKRKKTPPPTPAAPPPAQQ
jgi:hypothetical protein